MCGVRTPEEALHAMACGAAYLGLNFYPQSPRALDLAAARRIRAACDEAEGSVSLVGVFVDHPPNGIAAIKAAVPLDLVQLHGGEARDGIAVPIAAVVKAFQPDENLDLGELLLWSNAYGWLFDTPHATLQGGTGESWDYHRVQEVLALARASPLAPVQLPRVFLAGGINPDTVCSALLRSGEVYALDSCSGLEREPGVKDPEKVAALFEALGTIEIDGGQGATCPDV